MPGKAYNGTLFLGPNAQLYAQYGGQEKYLAAKKAFDDSKKKLEGQKKKYEADNQTQLTRVSLLTNLLNQAKTVNNQTQVAAIEAQLRDVRAKLLLTIPKWLF